MDAGDGLVVIPTPAGTSYSRAVAISGSLIVGDFFTITKLMNLQVSAHFPAEIAAKLDRSIAKQRL